MGIGLASFLAALPLDGPLAPTIRNITNEAGASWLINFEISNRTARSYTFVSTLETLSNQEWGVTMEDQWHTHGSFGVAGHDTTDDSFPTALPNRTVRIQVDYWKAKNPIEFWTDYHLEKVHLGRFFEDNGRSDLFSPPFELTAPEDAHAP